MQDQGSMVRDVFISYASEDRAAVAAPLAARLAALGLSVWFDKVELHLGDSLRRRIDNGLANCRFGIVVLSPAFFRKHYTNLELDGLAQREVSGKKVILPIWLNVGDEHVRQYSPLLADRIAALWDDGIDEVVRQVVAVVRPDLLQAPTPGDNDRGAAQPSAVKEETASLKGLNLQPFSFRVASVATDGRVQSWRKVAAKLHREEVRPGLVIEMVFIPGGSFIMGDDFVSGARPSHTVTVKPFLIGRYPVRQKEWQTVCLLPQVSGRLPHRPFYFWGQDLPVENVSWEQTCEFCLRLSRHTRRPYRLPTEAEWEYAARAGRRICSP